MNLLSRCLMDVALCRITLVLIFEIILHWRVRYVISLEKYWIISVTLLLYNSSLLASWYHSCCICFLLVVVNHCCNVWCGGKFPFFGKVHFFGIFKIVFNMLFHVFQAVFEGLDWSGQVYLDFGYAVLFPE